MNKLKTYEKMFIYNYSFYDRNDFKYKIYYFSPDQEHQYLSLDLTKDDNDMYKCEMGLLYLTDNSLFEDTPNYSYKLSIDIKSMFDKYTKNKKTWSNKKIKDIKEVFLAKDLII